MTDEPIYAVKVHARGYVDGPADYLMSDGSIRTMTTEEAGALADATWRREHAKNMDAHAPFFRDAWWDSI